MDEFIAIKIIPKGIEKLFSLVVSQKIIPIPTNDRIKLIKIVKSLSLPYNT